MACPGCDAIERAVARRVPRRSGVRQPALSGDVARAKTDRRPRTSGRDGPEHPAAVPEVPRHCQPRPAAARRGRYGIAPTDLAELSCDRTPRLS